MSRIPITTMAVAVSLLAMDRVDSVNDSPEMFLRNDTPGCVRHTLGDTFSEIYLNKGHGKLTADTTGWRLVK